MKYQIEVNRRPDCCEVGAFGLHFAYGKAETDQGFRMKNSQKYVIID